MGLWKTDVRLGIVMGRGMGVEGKRVGMRGVELQSGVEGVMISWGRGVILMVCFLSIVVVAFPSAHSSVLFA